MQSISFTCIFIATTLSFTFSSNVSSSPDLYDGSDNYTLDALYTVEEIHAHILDVLEELDFHQYDADSQETICTSWALYEDFDAIDMEPDGTEGRYCPSYYDNITCWPPSPPGEVHLRCPRNWHGIQYRSNVTRYCHLNGTWETIADYTNCQVIGQETVYLEIATVILYAGYSLSFVSLTVAFCIFLAFKSLRCLRNYIHWNFITSFIFLYIMFFCNHQMIRKSYDNLTVCRLLMTLIIYAHCTNFFWMFVEGLYLYTLVVMALKPEKMTLVKYCLIGWGIPVVITVIYAICELQFGSGCWASIGAEITPAEGQTKSVQYLEFIFVGPVIFILTTNCFFLFHIGFILMTKLKASHSFETKQYRKALRGIILLLPLLGVTGIIFVVSTGETHPVLVIINALLHSFEGFFVVLIYVFCNQEVQRVIKRKIHHWREEQSLPTRQVSRRGSHSRQNSIVSAMFAKHNGDSVAFDKARNNSRSVGCCNFSKSQKNDGYNIMAVNSFDASTRQSSIDGITTEKCFTKPGFESISEVSTGKEDSYSRSENNSVSYQEKNPDSNQNVKLPSNNGSATILPTHAESDLMEDALTQQSNDMYTDSVANSQDCFEALEPEEHNALLEKPHDSELEPGEEDSECQDTENSALMSKENDSKLSDDLTVDIKHTNSMILPRGLTIGTQI